MSVAIRLKRIGRKNRPVYKIVVQEKRSKKDGGSLAELGFYDCSVKPPALKVDEPKLDQWLKNGAQLSQTLKKILNR